MPIMIRVCRRTPIMGLITLLLCAVRDSAASHLLCFHSGCARGESPVLGLCTQVSSGGAHQDSRFLGKCWFWGSAGSAAEGQPSTWQNRCRERLSCPTFRGAHGLCVEQDFSPWTLLSVNGTNSFKSLLLARFPSSLYLLIRLLH